MSTPGDLIVQVRRDLQETTPQIWSDTALLDWINAGIAKVALGMHSVIQDWLTRRMKSTDPVETIFGSSFDPSGLKITGGTNTYTLPPNMIEIRSLEPLNQSDINLGIRFIPRNINSLDFMSAGRLTSSAAQITYFYDEVGLTNLVIAPTPATGTSIDVNLLYVAHPETLDAGTTITQLPVQSFEAVKAYAMFRAYRSIAHPDANLEFARYKEELADLKDFSSPRESQDPLVVEGMFDEDDQLPVDFTY